MAVPRLHRLLVLSTALIVLGGLTGCAQNRAERLAPAAIMALAGPASSFPGGDSGFPELAEAVFPSPDLEAEPEQVAPIALPVLGRPFVRSKLEAPVHSEVETTSTEPDVFEERPILCRTAELICNLPTASEETPATSLPPELEEAPAPSEAPAVATPPPSALPSVLGHRVPIRLEVMDLFDPVSITEETEYVIRVSNLGLDTFEELTLTACCPLQLRPVFLASMECPEGRVLTQAPFDLPPQATRTFRLRVRAEQEGPARTRVTLQGESLSEPVVQEESTTIVPAKGTLRAPTIHR